MSGNHLTEDTETTKKHTKPLYAFQWSRTSPVLTSLLTIFICAAHMNWLRHWGGFIVRHPPACGSLLTIFIRSATFLTRFARGWRFIVRHSPACGSLLTIYYRKKGGLLSALKNYFLIPKRAIRLRYPSTSFFLRYSSNPLL